jgi:tetratricopeptide (TPR) repeat protein
MIPSPFTQRRLLVPRWRKLSTTIQANELAVPAPAKTSQTPSSISPNLRSKLEQWRARPGLVTAGELVEAALVEGQEREAVPAARTLISIESTATLPLRRLAALALKRAGHEDEIPSGLEIHPSVGKGVWRQRTRLYPFNPLAWVELSLYEVNQGRKEEARRSMLVALQQAPNNRHVLRSASRLFLHLRDPDRAHDIIAKNDATGTDPWLIAAELSISALAEKRPRFSVQGRRILDDGGLVPGQITELAGALGTLELEAGRRKKARDLFRQSLVDPTGNALAQAEWASPIFGLDLVSSSRLVTVPEADEATVFHLIREDKLSDVPAACIRWSETELYSIRPFEIGSSSAAQIGKYEQALSMAEKGLMKRPNAGLLVNSRAFALANLGRLDEAQRSLCSIGQGDQYVWFLSEANRGLVAMRRGEHALGLELYKKAIEGFRRLKNDICVDAAQLYLAREAAKARIPKAGDLVEKGKDIARRRKLKSFDRVLREAEQALALAKFPLGIAGSTELLK